MPRKTGSAVAKTQPQKLWDEMSDSEQMTANSRSALAKIEAVLELEIDPENARLTGIITNAALQTIATKVRIDEGQFSQQQERLAAERERVLKALVADLPERFRPRREGSASARDSAAPVVSEAPRHDPETGKPK